MWKSRTVFALAILFAFLLIGAQSTYVFGFTLLYALGLLLLLSIVSIAFAPKLLTVNESLNKETVEKNEVFYYTSQVFNKGLMPYYCIDQTYGSSSRFRGFGPQSATALRPRGNTREEYSLSFPYRGRYAIGLEQMVVLDFLGLFRRTLLVPSPASVLVHPMPAQEFHEESLGQLEEKAREKAAQEDYTTIMDVRQHRPGESLKKVHWPLSAKWNELMIKNFETFSDSNVTLFLDTKAVNLPDENRLAFEDSVVSMVAAAAQYHLLEGTPVELLYGVEFEDTLTLDSMAQETSLYDLLAMVPFSHPYSLIDDYYNALHPLAHPLLLYFFLFDASPELLRGFTSFIASGYHLVLYYFFSQGLPMQKEQRQLLTFLESLGVTVYTIEVSL